jgi:uncharacterized protein
VKLRFEWDFKKATANRRKHGVSFEEAAAAFADPLSMTVPDPDHAAEENRFVLVGRSSRERLVLVVYVERGDTIRIVSARTPTRRERAQYEEEV